MMVRGTRAVIGLAALAMLAGCGSSEPVNTSASTPAVSSTNAMTATPTSTSASSNAAATQGADEGDRDASGNLTKSFGSTFTWDDGTAITVTAPKPYTPSQTAAIDPAKKQLNEYVVMDVTVKNGTKAAINPMVINVQATTGDEDAEAVFDSEKGIDMPTADILPGQSKHWKAVFARQKGQPFVVQVSNGFAANGYYK